MKRYTGVGVLAALAAIAGVPITGCSSQEPSQPRAAQSEATRGAVALTLQPVAGITLSTVHYAAVKQTTLVAEGDLPTPGNAATFSFGLPLPTGTGYVLSLSAVANENTNITCVGASAPFDIAPNTSSKVTLVLSCTDATSGNAETGVTVVTDACPRLIVDYVVASPNTAFLPAGTIAVAGNAHDLDGKAVTYSWRAANPAVGSFAPVNAAASTFSCAQDSGSGGVDLVLTADNGQCQKSLPTSVNCVNLTCGNGVLDPGEICDPAIPNSPCRPNCTLIECGDGVVDVPFETCDLVPRNPLLCDASCHLVPSECGDGILGPLEQCDGNLFPPNTPPGWLCNPDCTIGNTGIECGDGIVLSSLGEVCDPALSVDNCGRNCQAITSAACLACESAPGTCAPSILTCDTASGGTTTATVTGSSGAAKATDPGAVTTPVGARKVPLCNEVLDCVRDSGCAANGNPALKSCYCGTATISQCTSGLGNGPCKAELERALETTDFATVSQRVGNSLYGGGVAMRRIDCDQSFCDPVCFQ